MASIQTVQLPHYPAYPVFISLFKNVKNASFLRQQLLEGNAAFEYAFLDATMILSQAHLLAATFRALHDHLSHRLRSHNPHSEIVFSLSPNNNIAESFRRFGISDTSSTIIAVKIALTPEVTAESVAKHLGENVEGESVDLGGDGKEGLDKVLVGVSDLELIKKVYKLGSEGGGGGKKGKGKGGTEEDRVNGVNGVHEDDREEMEHVILGIMALKGS